MLSVPLIQLLSHNWNSDSEGHGYFSTLVDLLVPVNPCSRIVSSPSMLVLQTSEHKEAAGRGVVCEHSEINCVRVLVAQSCPILWDPMDYSPPGSSVYGISLARILEWVAISSPEDLPDPGIEPRSPTLQTDLYCLSHQRSQCWIQALSIIYFLRMVYISLQILQLLNTFYREEEDPIYRDLKIRRLLELVFVFNNEIWHSCLRFFKAYI